jgi:hypothetical protein
MVEGRFSFAVRSIAASACPELFPGAGLEVIAADG